MGVAGFLGRMGIAGTDMVDDGRGEDVESSVTSTGASSIIPSIARINER